jgi:hypothetical protein
MKAPSQTLRIAVVGHTNTGKTSLLRTLTRDRTFGEVADRPGVTREVAGTVLLVGDKPAIELYDTPGLEDSIGLLDLLLSIRTDEREDGPTTIARFLNSEAARGPFIQEAKALHRLLHCDAALHVIDARDRVLAKHRDELQILALCGQPILPVLNFVAHSEAQPALWRTQLSRHGLHAVAEFDTVAVTEEGEQELFNKLKTLIDTHRDLFTALIEDRARRRQQLINASIHRIAELLVDVAALHIVVPLHQSPTSRPSRSQEEHSQLALPVPMTAIEDLRRYVRQREQRCLDDLLEWHRFHPDDCAPDLLPIVEGHWGMDIFNRELLKQFGLRTTSAAAAGAMAGLAVDAVVGGISLGAAALTGAALGALFGAGRMQGRRLWDKLRGRTELRCQDATIHLLAARQIHLLKALLRRGHASQTPVRLTAASLPTHQSGRPTENIVSGEGATAQPLDIFAKGLPHPLSLARANPDWCLPSDGNSPDNSPERQSAVDTLARQLTTSM